MVRRAERPGGRNRQAWIAGGLFALAVVIVATAMAPLLIALLRAGDERMDVPGTTVRHLGTGEHLLLPHAATSDSYGPVTVTSGDGSVVTDITVTGPDGSPVELRTDHGTTVDLNGDHYRSIASFHIEAAGDYTIAARSTAPTTMLVTRDPFDGIAPRLVGWAVGATLGLGAGVWWIVAMVRGGRRRRAAEGLPPPPAPPAPPPPPHPPVAPT